MGSATGTQSVSSKCVFHVAIYTTLCQPVSQPASRRTNGATVDRSFACSARSSVRPLDRQSVGSTGARDLAMCSLQSEVPSQNGPKGSTLSLGIELRRVPREHQMSAYQAEIHFEKNLLNHLNCTAVRQDVWITNLRHLSRLLCGPRISRLPCWTLMSQCFYCDSNYFRAAAMCALPVSASRTVRLNVQRPPPPPGYSRIQRGPQR